MAIPRYTPDEEEQMLTEIADIGNRTAQTRSQLESSGGQELSDVIAEMNAAFPSAQADVLLAVSQAITSGVMTQDQAVGFVQDFQNKAILNAQAGLAPGAVGSGAGGGGGGMEDTRGWFAKYVKDPFYDAVKTSSRYGIAGISTVEQMLTNVETRLPQEVVRPGDMSQPTYELNGARAYRPKDDWWDVKSFFETTDLYQLLSGKDAGEGFFVGGEARAAQQSAAMDYRGAIQVENPNAPGGAGFEIVGMTPGRMIGTAFARPGSEQYNNVSGIIDGILVLTAPSGVPTAKAGVGRAVEKASDVTRGSLRSTFGLTNGFTPFVRSERVGDFLMSGNGQRLVRDVVNVENISDARRLLPNATARTWNEFVQASNDTEALSVLERVLGAERGAMTTSEMNWSNWSNVKSAVLRNPAFRYLGVERKLTRAPSRNLVIGFATDAEITETVKNAEDWLKIVYKSPAERNPVLNRLTNALLEQKGDIKNSITEFKTIFADAVERFGVPREFAEAVFERGIREGDEMNAFGVLDDSGLGQIYNASANRYLFQDDAGNLAEGWMTGRATRRGWTDSEHARYTIHMPDPRAVQRLTKPINWFFSRAGVNKAGKQILNPPLPPQMLTDLGKPRFPVALMDFLHNKLFNRAALGSGGYGWRIANEGLMAQSFAPGIKTGVFHPVELVSALLFRRKNVGKYKGPITGEQWSDVLGTFRNNADAEKVLNETFKDAVDFVEGGLTRDLDPGVLEKATHAAGSWEPAFRGGDNYVVRVADNIHLLANDRISRLLAEGRTPQEIIALAQGGDRRILQALKDFEARKAGEGFIDLGGQTQKGSFKIFDSNGTIIESNAVGIIEDYFVQRLRAFTVGDQRLLDIVRNGGEYGRFLPTGATEEVNAFTRLREGLFGPEAYADYSDEFIGVINEILEAVPDAFPKVVKGRVNRVTNVISGVPESQKAVIQGWNNFMRRMFSEILTRPDKTLNRSVVWRKFYYEGIDLLLPQLDQGEAARIVANLEKAAAKEGAKFTDAWAGRFIGSKETWKRIVGMADGSIPATGSRTVEEISAVARGFAADRASEVLYNAAEKNNLAVALSVIEPFINAVKDGVTRWPRLLLSQPNETKRLYNGFEGLAQADPDNDGQGYFYVHPTTGQWSYNYPTGLLGSKTLASLLYGTAGSVLGGAMFGIPGMLAGGGGGGYLGYSTADAISQSELDTRMVGQLRTANVAISALPSGGPALTIPASWLLTWGPTRKVIPAADEIYAFMTPYGAQSPESLVLPSWTQKMADIIADDPNTASLVADARIQAYDALLATGNYTSKTNDPDEQSQMDADLLDDASQVATHMVLQRALGQFILPMRPNIELVIPTKFEGQITIDEVTTMVNGNISNAVLARAYGLLREEDPATAVRKYLEFFGDDAIGYLVGRTYTNIDGLQATREFDQWEQDNPEIVKAAPDVYPYFAGRLGTDIDFTKYQSQIATGQRDRWKDPEARRESAEYFVGSRLYQAALQSMAYDPNPLQKEYLKEYRAELVKMFPGYGTAPFDINELPRKISQLEDAARLEVTQSTEAGTAMRSYFAMRDRVLMAADARGSSLSADENADLRSVLLLHGIGLTQQYPSFQMVWDDVLFREIDG